MEDQLAAVRTAAEIAGRTVSACSLNSNRGRQRLTVDQAGWRGAVAGRTKQVQNDRNYPRSGYRQMANRDHPGECTCRLT